MKEIKCRAWDKIDKRMIDDAIVIDFQSGKFYNYYYFTPSTRSSDLFEKDEHGNYSIPIKNGKADISRYIIMQYTGLSDKNGKEIYEGDIIDDHWNNAFGEKIHPKFLVIEFGEHETCEGDYYSSTAYGFYLKNLENNETYSLPYHQPIEVIGNIYESKSLLID